jgi:putative nucleotidyltransferase with HDIG domain
LSRLRRAKERAVAEKGRVLIVDDEAGIRGFLCDALNDGCEVFTAENGEEAIGKIKEIGYNVVVTDIKMPGVSGVELLRLVKELQPDTEVIILTAYASLDTAIAALHQGAYDYITKPVKIENIRNTVKNALEKNRLASENKMLLKSLKEANEELRNYISHVEKMNQALERINEENILLSSQSKKLNQELSEKVEQATFELRRANIALKDNYLSTIQALAAAVEMKNPYTRGHSVRVAGYTTALCRRLGYSEEDVVMISYAAILHDVGKIGIDEKVLTKPGRLSESEFGIIRLHPKMGDEIIRPVEFLGRWRSIVRNHHEHYDGSGYVDGLKGQDIPLEARIVTVTDVYDALTSDRPYRKGLAPLDAVEVIKRGAGIQFDPDVVRVFVELIEKEET